MYFNQHLLILINIQPIFIYILYNIFQDFSGERNTKVNKTGSLEEGLGFFLIREWGLSYKRAKGPAKFLEEGNFE